MGIFDFFKSTTQNYEGSERQMQPQAVPVDGQLLVVEDTFSIKGRGTVAMGTAQGAISRGQRVTLHSQRNGAMPAVVEGIEAFNATSGAGDEILAEVAKAGDSVGVLLSGIEQNQIKRGDIISTVS